MKPRKNEKKFHKSLVDAVNKELGGYGYKAQRGFIKGVPDVELKVPHLPLVKAEIKHEVYAKVPNYVPIGLTMLQRLRLRDMQKANLSSGWASFINIGKRVVVVYGTDPRAGQVCIEYDTYKDKWKVRSLSSVAMPESPIDHFMEIEEWINNQQLAVISKMLNLWTRPQLYSKQEEPFTESLQTTPK